MGLGSASLALPSLGRNPSGGWHPALSARDTSNEKRETSLIQLSHN